LSYCDLYARPIDFLGIGGCSAGACDITVINLHECGAERQVVSASWIARREPENARETG